MSRTSLASKCRSAATALALCAAAILATLTPLPAQADGMAKKSAKAAKAAPAEEPKRDWALTANVAVATEYVFRGFSQTAERPAVQGGIDVTYKWFYAGLWASNLDFGTDLTPAGNLNNVAHVEIDWYAGIKHAVGPVTLDVGLIYYTYPRALDGPLQTARELDYVEVKLGVSGDIYKGGTLGLTVFYSPEYTNRQGEVWTVEGSFAHVLHAVHNVTPTFSALLGYQTGDDPRFLAITGNGDDHYFYWNAGLTLGFGDRLSIDLRYWDTSISNAGNFCTGAVFQCDERFVATAKVTY